MKGKDPDSLPNQTVQTSIQLHNDCFKSWYSCTETILNELKTHIPVYSTSLD